jgi:hypothetical protein
MKQLFTFAIALLFCLMGSSYESKAQLFDDGFDTDYMFLGGGLGFNSYTTGVMGSALGVNASVGGRISPTLTLSIDGSYGLPFDGATLISPILTGGSLVLNKVANSYQFFQTNLNLRINIMNDEDNNLVIYGLVGAGYNFGMQKVNMYEPTDNSLQSSTIYSIGSPTAQVGAGLKYFIEGFAWIFSESSFGISFGGTPTTDSKTYAINTAPSYISGSLGIRFPLGER